MASNPAAEGTSEEEDTNARTTAIQHNNNQQHQQLMHGDGQSHGGGGRYNVLVPSPLKSSAEHQAAQLASAASLATAAAAAACVNHSVVPDLMRVYESMTQSSTPAQGGGAPQHGDYVQSQQALHSLYLDPHQESSMYYQAPQQPQAWSVYDTSTSSIPIPPPYPLPQQMEQSRRLSCRSDSGSTSGNLQQQQQQQQSGGVSTSGRSLRAKRSGSSAAVEDPNAGYESSAGDSSRGTSKSRRKGNSKNNGGGSSKAGDSKRDEKNDGRWSKRFTWPDDLHRDFVSAIFDVGLKHSSPSTVMEHMPAHEQITTERIKSHLQKYRLHRQKSKKEFMTSYQATVQQLNAEGIDSVSALAGGQVAGHLTFASLTQPDPEPMEEDEEGDAAEGDESQGNDSTSSKHLVPAVQVEEPQQDIFVLPRLTDAEKHSQIGTSLGYLMGLFFSLRQQLENQRDEQEALAADQKRLQEQQALHLDPQDQQHSTVAVFDAFVSEPQASKGVAAAGPTPMAVPSSTRSNLEVNSMMKREMQNQMAFQNKMRALKQQELNKYHKMGGAASPGATDQMLPPDEMTATPIDGAARDAEHQSKQQQEYQRAGETGGADAAGRDRSQSMSLRDEDDFWNTAVVDDELFDFLMNN